MAPDDFHRVSLLPFHYPKWPMMGLATAALVLATLAGLATPSFFGRMIDTTVNSDKQSASEQKRKLGEITLQVSGREDKILS